MCAIFGSPNVDRFKELYQANLDRGHSAFGMVAIDGVNYNNDRAHVFKTKGIAEIDKLIQTEHIYAPIMPDKFASKCSNKSYFLGHTQAPTSTAQEFDPMTSHPFEYEDWVVAHNGVLTNYNEITAGLDPFSFNVVDSSVIPAFLFFYKKQHPTLHINDVLIHVLGSLKGTHSTWIYNKTLNKFFIARCGSTLYANLAHNEFSSTPLPGMDLIKDGDIYCYGNRKLEHVGSFSAQSP